MSVKVKGTPELTRPNGSHSLVLGYNGREFGPFDREELLFPVLEVDAPRGYTLDGAATLLEELETRGDIDSHQASTVRGAIRRLYEALDELEAIA